jgi:bifunctional non-homologous end joining protein LigD
MPLDTYRRKRDFSRTPEPAGGEPPAPGHRFVVQRHRATRLHYDFRLEIAGVLASWAVPRGPTLDPGVRRMAIRTEDHPIEYFDFEGVIPKGEYGAGDVIVWDWGTFQPEETDDAAAALRNGELKFALDGEKLRGRFTIVDTTHRGRDAAGGDEKDSWLLIKERDAHAVAGWDAEEHPRSVKSGRTNDEVASGVPAIWNGAAPAGEAAIDLSAAREEPMPQFIEPMAATLADRPFSDDDWLFEVKWDGYRVEAVVRDGRVRLWTRRGNDAGTYFPDLTGAPTWISARQAIVDGEVVALDDEGNPSFSLLQDRTGIRGVQASDGRRSGRRPRPENIAATPLVYQVFDLLYVDGKSMLDVPLEQRKRLLRTLLRPDSMVRYAADVPADGEAFYEAARQRGLEGIVAKLRSSRYEPGRRPKSWLKIKLRAEQELVVAGWLEGKGSHKELGSLIVGVYDGDELRHAGQVGSGIDTRTRGELLRRLHGLARDSSPLTPTPRIRGAHWVEPRLVIRAEFAEWTTDGLLRQAAFKGLELDKDPGSVHRERAVETRPAARAAERAQPAPRPAKRPAPPEREPSNDAAIADAIERLQELDDGGLWQIGEHELRLTNLNKPIWPEDGIAKRDLIRYYVSIAPLILPYLARRAVNLHRYPDGVGHGRGFWQKDVPGHAPDWISRWQYTGHEGTKDYIVVDRPATLAWLAQEAAVEIHPWTSTTDAPHMPSYALIDIDPGDRTTWEEVVTLARLYRTALDHLGVTGFPKVTGQRGVQIWVPVRQVYTFDQTREWVERLSRVIAQTVPDLISWEWTKRARGGRARLDYTQNAVNRTLVAPYSVRPASGAPVSTPIRWDEFDDSELRADRWTINTIAERVAAVGDLFAGALELEQELPTL